MLLSGEIASERTGPPCPRKAPSADFAGTAQTKSATAIAPLETTEKTCRFTANRFIKSVGTPRLALRFSVGEILYRTRSRYVT